MSFRLTLVSQDSAVARAAAFGNATVRDFLTPDQIYFDMILGKGWASTRVALDMDAVAFVDSSAIGWLIHSQKIFREAGGKLVLHSVQPQVKNILSLLKIERVVPIARDATAAEALLSGVSPAAVG